MLSKPTGYNYKDTIYGKEPLPVRKDWTGYLNRIYLRRTTDE